jgi:hypothetical protein
MCGVDHLGVYGSSVPSKLPEQVFPDATPRPAYEAVIDRRWGTIGFRAIAPAATALEHVHDPADHASVVCALNATHISRQMRLNPCPLLVAQPEQISAHQFFPNTNQYRIVQTEKLMSSDPSLLSHLTGDPSRARPTRIDREKFMAARFAEQANAVRREHRRIQNPLKVGPHGGYRLF